MKRMPLAALLAASVLLLLAACTPASVATSVTAGSPSSMAAHRDIETTPIAFWGTTHATFGVVLASGDGDCRAVATSVTTQSIHTLTVVFQNPGGLGKVCASVLATSTYLFDTPEAIDQSHPVTVTVSYDSHDTAISLP